jgi:hypothetical protein
MQLVTGRTIDRTRFEFERPDIVYPYLQVVEKLPIEHTALVASRREGQTVSTVRGTVIHRYSIVNKRPASNAEAIAMGQRALLKLEGVKGEPTLRRSEPVLVLLPYGNDQKGDVALRHAWRMPFNAKLNRRDQSFMVWIDAETGDMLKLESLTSEVSAKGSSWRRDPGSGAGPVRDFEVDPAGPESTYRLQLATVANRVNFKGDNDDGNDLEIPSDTNGSGPTLANFDHGPINIHTTAVCAHQENTAFQQVNLFALLLQNRSLALDNGMFEPFPIEAWTPSLGLEEPDLCGAWSTMSFGACQGYQEEKCPNWVLETDPLADVNYMNFAHDASIVAHEVGHEAVAHLTFGRPGNWCELAECPVPVGYGALHDLADAWADHVVNTNCVGGWVAKNIGGVDASKDCKTHVEGDRLPRLHELKELHELSVPFAPAAPGDRFPERRASAITANLDYVDMQVAAAVLWQVREGMRSKEGMIGEVQYFKRLIGALKQSGVLGLKPENNDLGIYAIFQDLALELTDQWADALVSDGGNFTTNEVLAAYARGGLFLIPPECLDGDATTANSPACSGSNNGADAVIDIDDSDSTDGPMFDGIQRAESDYLTLGGPEPVFHVWTGPRYSFVGGNASFAGQAPCNSQFQVEVSPDPSFLTAQTENSGWRKVDETSTGLPGSDCYETWKPRPEQWSKLQNDAVLKRLYYRVTTRDGAEANERRSTEPLNGLWTVNPPFAVLTDDGHGLL